MAGKINKTITKGENIKQSINNRCAALFLCSTLEPKGVVLIENNHYATSLIDM